MNIEAIPVKIETTQHSSQPEQLVFGLLQEIHAHLQRLQQDGQTFRIDLKSLPLSEHNRSQLIALLGQGEISCEFNSSGSSRIYETAYSGIWWITHYSPDQQIMAEFIDICLIPDILASHPDDVLDAEKRLAHYLKNL